MRRPFSAQVFLYRERPNGSREFLLFKRHARPDLALPAFWQGISGALEVGESFEEAARREVLEESGLRIAVLVPSRFIHTYPIKPEWRVHYGPGPVQVEERVFGAQVAADAMPMLSEEHREWAWCGVEAACEKLSFGQNRPALLAVLAAIEAASA